MGRRTSQAPVAGSQLDLFGPAWIELRKAEEWVERHRNHPRGDLDYQRAWREAHPDYQQAWRQAHPGYHKARYQRVNEQKIKTKRERQEARRLEVEARRQERAERNTPERKRERRQEWAVAYRLANKERIRARLSTRLAKRRGGQVDPFMETEAGIQAVIELQKSSTHCAYCHARLIWSTTQIDHRIPLKRGGRHEIPNLAIVCSTCNRLKYDRTEDEFREYMRTEMLERILRITA